MLINLYKCLQHEGVCKIYILYVVINIDTHRTPVPNWLIPVISEAEETTVAVTKLEQRAQSRLLEVGHYFLEDLTHLLPQDILQAIIDDTISPSWYMQMRDRVEELKRGHLSSGDSDHTQGAIHWFEGECC